MEFKKTGRGFALYEFKDSYDKSCSLQESSSAEEEKIWFGINDAEPKIMASKTFQGGTGWVPYPIPEDVLLNTRMHLTRDQVRELLPILINFVETGDIRMGNK